MNSVLRRAFFNISRLSLISSQISSHTRYFVSGHTYRKSGQSLNQTSAYKNVCKKTLGKELVSVFPNVVHEVTQFDRREEMPDVAEWFSKVLHYTVPTGGKNCATDLMFAYLTLANPEQLTQENIRKAQIMSWCTEMLVAVIFVSDDLMDGSEMRRGQPCWYHQDGVGVSAVNDCFLLEGGMYQLLKKTFGEEKYYMDVVEIFHEVSLKTSLGQCLDLLTSKGGRTLDFFTESRYNTLVQHKSSYFFTYLPVAIAMKMVGMTDHKSELLARSVLDIAHFIQVENDYLDCYGDPAVTGKEGTDIQNGALTWLVVNALKKVSGEMQKKILQECYGLPDPVAVSRIKQLYDDLGMQSAYFAYKEEKYAANFARIQKMSPGPVQDLFFSILENIYRKNNYNQA